ncbi:MAG: TIGR03619 family F420-dependent LLM class oxidoreductase, partial [Alphaproteobacteria bacterium]
MLRPAVRFGLGLPVVQQVPARVMPWEAAAGPAEIERVARAADRLGFAHVACSDHPVVPVSRVEAMGATWYDPIATLAHVGGITERVELLTHVLVAAYRPPLVLAKSLATLDLLSRGRLVVGLGSGHLKPEFASLGADFEGRGAVTDEVVAVLLAAWTQSPARHDGDRFRFRDLVLEPRPARRPRPPIWVGGNSRRAVRRAALLADGWIPWEIPDEQLRESIERAREWRAGAGREGAWEVVVPLRPIDLVGASRDAEGASRSTDEVALDVERLRGIGATRFHVAFHSRSCDGLVEQMEAFA